ncbi:hypothetical protein ABT075_37445 [Streptomyces sp. NPDC002677]|uniref:hypothetical protein n=1 Tax=Streptomyces sp. NPDC002677 TaxID=3154774 RepID=UPI003327DCF1
MTRRSGRTGPGPAGRTPDGRGHLVAVVVPEPRDAVAVVEREAPGSEIAVVCLRPGGKDGRAALDRALAAAESRGCRVRGGPRVLDSDPRQALPALREELRALDPERLHTLDPDPVHTGLDEASGMPSYGVPDTHAETAAVALAAARAHQAGTGRPLYVDCLRAEQGPGGDGAPRHPAPVNWLSAGFDGRLTAFWPTAAGVVRWYEELPGGRWRGPELLEGPGLLPGLLVVRDPHGLPHLLGLRRTARGDGGVDVEVVHAAQYRTGRPLTPWHSLGGPNAAAWRKGREVGFPAAAFDAAGDLHVFVRNFGHSVSHRRRSADGTWTPWQHLSGLRVADDLVAMTAEHGGVELFARARDTSAVLRWCPGADGTWSEDRTLPLAARPGSLTPAAEPGAVLFRDARTGRTCFWRPGAPGPYPLDDPLDDPESGSGAPSAARGAELAGWGYSVLVGRGADGTCSLGAHPAGRPDTGVWWQDVGAPSYGAPAAAVSRAGRLAVATRTPGGRLLVARRDESRDGLVLDGWRPVGD